MWVDDYCGYGHLILLVVIGGIRYAFMEMFACVCFILKDSLHIDCYMI